MDVDMALEDLIPKKAPSAPRGGGRGGASGGREGGGRPAPAQRSSSGPRLPYARPAAGATESSWKHDMFGSGERSARPGAAAGPGGAGSFRGPQETNQPTPKLKIKGLHYEIGVPQLQKIFAQAGTIVDGPTIAFDRSGRSTGIAYVTYSNIESATFAKTKLDGQKANGEPITITYHELVLPKSSGISKSAGAPAGPGAPLLGRLGGVLGSDAPKSSNSRSALSAPRAAAAPRDGPRPPRDGPRPARGGGRGGARGGAAGGGRPARKEPATGDSLDAELEAFMKTPAAPAAASASAAMEE